MAERPARAAFVYDPSLARHVLRADHPLRAVRLQQTFELATAYGAFDDPGAMLVPPRPATREELLTFHASAYVDAVRRYSDGGQRRDAEAFGFSDGGDNPIFAGMYDAAALACGGSVVAADLVAEGRALVAFSVAGGLHHAMASRASGFCVFNDPVVAINALRRRGLRVAYVDIDAHHGDGVQAAYYEDPDVLTVSLHESGRYLFPGSGEVEEMGRGAGRGFSINVPLFPYTDDAVYLDAFDAVVPPLLRAFGPDVIATQLGVDAHARDPLTHLALTTRGFVALVERFGDMHVPWLAFGGGGYHLDVVARSWTLAYGVMLGREWPDELPVGLTFLKSRRLRDEPGEFEGDAAARGKARAFAEEQVAKVRRLIFPLHHIAAPAG